MVPILGNLFGMKKLLDKYGPVDHPWMMIIKDCFPGRREGVVGLFNGYLPTLMLNDPVIA